MEFLKKNFKLIIILIITILITASITVYATTTYLASSIEYTRTGKNVNNVGAALDDLYNTTSAIAQTNATATDILNGKKAYTNTGLVTGNLVTPTSYSTTEQVVGTWIDNSPLYQKTITGTTPSTTANDNYDLGLPTNAVIRTAEGMTSDSGGYGIPLGPWGSIYTSGSQTFAWGVNKTNKYQLYLSCGTSTQNKPFWITVRYTKTTD